MDNLEIYERVRHVPNEAKKNIVGGRLKGMTDINPMWRIKTLTELFGPCGIGWTYAITNKQLLQGANNEQIAIVDIELEYRYNGEWSRPVPGTGGSSFVAKERNGLYTSDEAFKMAMTDALSVACKNLGIGADVYFEKDVSKYNPNPNPEEQEKEKLRKNLSDIVGIKGIAPQKMTELIQERYQKQSSAELTIAELNDLKTYIAGI